MYIWIKNERLNVKDASSAIGNAHQTFPIVPVKDKSQAAGSKKINWRTKLIIIEWMPLPNAWKIEPRIIQIAAIGKWMAIIRKALVPIESISSEASKSFKTFNSASWSFRKFPLAFGKSNAEQSLYLFKVSLIAFLFMFILNPKKLI